MTKENIAEVTSCDFTEELEKAGCKAVIYVEYVPADGKTQELAPDDADRAFMDKRLAELRSRNTSMLYISFPGDEKSSGGCLAAGRGFFHINADGGAEPCPVFPVFRYKYPGEKSAGSAAFPSVCEASGRWAAGCRAQRRLCTVWTGA